MKNIKTFNNFNKVINERIKYRDDDSMVDMIENITFNDAPHNSMAKATFNYLGISNEVKVPSHIYDIVKKSANHSMEKSLEKPSASEMKIYREWVKEVKNDKIYK